MRSGVRGGGIAHRDGTDCRHCRGHPARRRACCASLVSRQHRVRGRQQICDLNHTSIVGAIVEAADRCGPACMPMAGSSVRAKGCMAAARLRLLAFPSGAPCVQRGVDRGGGVRVSSRAAGRTNHDLADAISALRHEASGLRGRQVEPWSMSQARVWSPRASSARWVAVDALHRAASCGLAANAACGLPAREPVTSGGRRAHALVGTQAAAGSLTCALTPSSCTMLPAASRPSATAVTTRSAPRTQSPPANSRGLLVW